MLWSERGNRLGPLSGREEQRVAVEGLAQHKKGGAIRGADGASKAGHRGGGRSRVADIIPRANFGSWPLGISFLPESNGMDSRNDAVPLRSA